VAAGAVGSIGLSMGVRRGGQEGALAHPWVTKKYIF